jgi:hypothetical protein
MLPVAAVSRIKGLLPFIAAALWLHTWPYIAEFIRAALYEWLLHMLTPDAESLWPLLSIEYALQYRVPIGLVAIGLWFFFWTGKKSARLGPAIAPTTNTNTKISKNPARLDPSESKGGSAKLGKLFASDDNNNLIWLKFRPDDPDKRAFHCMLALLFGYKEILRRDEVRKSVMNESLMKSGLKKPIGSEYLSPIASGPLDFYDSDEIYYSGKDSYKYDNNQYIEKGSLSRGGAFKLTAAGYERARSIVEDLIERG